MNIFENKIKISIIILTYKNFSGLKENLISIKKQSYQNYEVILADDSSPNFSFGLIEELFKKIGIKKFKIYSNENNLGTVKNYNKAIHLSDGDVIVPLSQDDRFFESDSLKKISLFFEEKNHNICLGLRIGEHSNKIYPRNHDLKIARSYNCTKIKNHLAKKNIYSGSSLYFRKKFFLDNGGFDCSFKLVEDYPFVFKCVIQNEVIYVLDYPTIFYGESGVSSSKKNSLNLIVMEDINLMYQKYCSQLSTFNFFTKRYIRFRDIMTNDFNAFKKYMYYFYYSDIILYKIFCKIFKW